MPSTLPIAYVALCVTLVLLPGFSAAGYQSLRHTTSELAAQGAPNAWVMRSIFVMLAAATVFDGWRSLGRAPLLRALVACFAISLCLTAVWSHLPIDPAAPADLHEDELHSLFSGATGATFTVLAVSAGFAAGPPGIRIMHVAVGLSASGLSWLIFEVPHFAGLWQRAIFLGAFAWLMFLFRTHRTALREGPR